MLAGKELALNELIITQTYLNETEIGIINTFSSFLGYIACLTEADIFINALTTNGYDSIVLKWAKPPKRSLYKKSVVGNLAHPFNEPAVYKTLVTGEPCFGVRGLSQERIPIAQTVVPLINTQNKVFAVLIMERDITEQVNQEAHVELLTETAEYLARTLMGVSVNNSNFPDHLQEGVVVLDLQGGIKYINHMATTLLQNITGFRDIPYLFKDLPQPLNEILSFSNKSKPWCEEFHIANQFLKIEGIPLLAKDNIEGTILILSDITDLREKEKELILKSVAIQEIHHRVKNNLQNVASLLRLQMRRLNHPVLKEAFAESIHRILSMALVYDELADQNRDEVDLQMLCSKVMKSLLGDNSSQVLSISSKIFGSTLFLPSSQAVLVALIINELVSNSLKHAFAERQRGTITLEIVDSENEVLLQLADNGVGFQPDQARESHLGLKIVKLFAEEQLNGLFNITSKNGTVASIRFPKKWQRRSVSCQNYEL